MEIEYLLGTCSSREIGELAETKGRKASYKNACAAIKRYNPDLYSELALNLINPWSGETNIKKGKILHIVHSAVDYLFKLK